MTLDAFSKVVAQADSRGAYLSSSQLDALSALVADGVKRIDVVNRITGSASTIVANASRSLFAEQPALIAPGGNAYTNRRAAACIRDLEIILRYVTYAIYAGDSSILDDRALNGLRETYLALGVPGASVAVGIQKIKEAAIAIANDPNGITRGDCSSLIAELGSYFDRAAAAVA
jgi:phycocyanin beta chain